MSVKVSVVPDKGRALLTCAAVPARAVLLEEHPLCLLPLDASASGTWALRPHEQRLAASVGGNVKAIALGLLAARVIEQLRSEVPAGAVSQAVQELCQPERSLVSLSPRLGAWATVARQLLLDLGMEVSADLCSEMVRKLACNVFTVTNKDSEPTGT